MHFCRHPIEMDWNNCFCPTCNRSLKFRGAHCAARRIDIYKNRGCTDIVNGPSSCDKSHPNGNHFISRPDVETAQSEMERARATVQANAMIDSAVGCGFRLEIRCGWSLSKSARFADFLRRRYYLSANA